MYRPSPSCSREQALTSDEGVSLEAKSATPVAAFSVSVQAGTPVLWYEHTHGSPSYDIPVGTLILPSFIPSAMVMPPSKSLPL